MGAIDGNFEVGRGTVIGDVGRVPLKTNVSDIVLVFTTSEDEGAVIRWLAASLFSRCARFVDIETARDGHVRGSNACRLWKQGLHR